MSKSIALIDKMMRVKYWRVIWGALTRYSLELVLKVSRKEKKKNTNSGTLLTIRPFFRVGEKNFAFSYKLPSLEVAPNEHVAIFHEIERNLPDNNLFTAG